MHTNIHACTWRKKETENIYKISMKNIDESYLWVVKFGGCFLLFICNFLVIPLNWKNIVCNKFILFNWII